MSGEIRRPFDPPLWDRGHYGCRRCLTNKRGGITARLATDKTPLGFGGAALPSRQMGADPAATLMLLGERRSVVRGRCDGARTARSPRREARSRQHSGIFCPQLSLSLSPSLPLSLNLSLSCRLHYCTLRDKSASKRRTGARDHLPALSQRAARTQGERNGYPLTSVALE